MDQNNSYKQQYTGEVCPKSWSAYVSDQDMHMAMQRTFQLTQVLVAPIESLAIQGTKRTVILEFRSSHSAPVYVSCASQYLWAMDKNIVVLVIFTQTGSRDCHDKCILMCVLCSQTKRLESGISRSNHLPAPPLPSPGGALKLEWPRLRQASRVEARLRLVKLSDLCFGPPTDPALVLSSAAVSTFLEAEIELCASVKGITRMWKVTETLWNSA